MLLNGILVGAEALLISVVSHYTIFVKKLIGINIIYLTHLKMKKTYFSVRKNYMLTLALLTASMFMYNQSEAQGKAVENSSAYVVTGKNNEPASVDKLKDVIKIQNNNGTYGIAKMYSALGKKQSETILHTGTNAIDVSLLPSGEYIICVTMDGGATYNEKFIKE
jgi:hypothetical protein